MQRVLRQVRQRLEGRADLEIEWGTVMVYTCAEDSPWGQRKGSSTAGLLKKGRHRHSNHQN
jgi:hypothetical protein